MELCSPSQDVLKKKFSKTLVDLTRTLRSAVYYLEKDGFDLRIYFEDSSYTVSLSTDGYFRRYLYERDEKNNSSKDEVFSPLPLEDEFFDPIYKQIENEPPKEASLEFFLDTPGYRTMEGKIGFEPSLDVWVNYIVLDNTTEPPARMSELTVSWRDRLNNDTYQHAEALVYRAEGIIHSMRTKEMEDNKILDVLEIPFSSRGEATRQLLEAVNPKKMYHYILFSTPR